MMTASQTLTAIDLVVGITAGFIVALVGGPLWACVMMGLIGFGISHSDSQRCLARMEDKDVQSE